MCSFCRVTRYTKLCISQEASTHQNLGPLVNGSGSVGVVGVTGLTESLCFAGFFVSVSVIKGNAAFASYKAWSCCPG